MALLRRPDQRTGEFAFVVKRYFVSFTAEPGQLRKAAAPVGHRPAGQYRAVDGIGEAGMMKTVQIGELQCFGAFAAEDIQIVFQQDAFLRQSTGLVDAEDVHASQDLHGVDVFNNGPLPRHGEAATREAGVDHQRQHLRRQPDGDGEGEGEGFQPAAARDAGDQKYGGDQNGHKAYQHPGDGIFAPLKGVGIFGIRSDEISVERIPSHRENDALAPAADHGGGHECEVLQSCEGRPFGVGAGGALLFEDRALSGDGGLRDKEVRRLYQPQVGRYPPARGEHHQVSHHQPLRGDIHEDPAAFDGDVCVDEAVQTVGGPLGPRLLNEANGAADEDHDADYQRRRDISCKIRGQQHIGNERDHRQREEDHREGIDEGPPQPVRKGIVFSAGEPVFAVLRAHRLHPLLRQSRWRRRYGAENLLRAAAGISFHAGVGKHSLWQRGPSFL